MVDRLAHDAGRVIDGPDLRRWIAEHGGEPMRMTQRESARFVESENEGGVRRMKDAGVGLH